MKRHRLNSLLAELLAAHRTARREDLAQALDACGLRQYGGPIFGVAFIAHDAQHWTPEPGGKPALVIPHFEDGRLLDLVLPAPCSGRDLSCWQVEGGPTRP